MEIGDSTWIITGCICLVHSALFSLIKEALYETSIYKMEKLFSKSDSEEEQKKLQLYVSHHDSMIWVATTLNAFFNLIFVVVTTLYYFSPGKFSTTLMSFATVFVVGGLFFLLAEIIPSMAAEATSNKILARLLPGIYRLTRILYPLRKIYSFINNVVQRLAGVTEDRDMNNAKEEIIEAAREGERFGLLEEESKRMIESIMQFKDADVSEIMIPRTEISTIEVATTVEEAVRFAIDTGHSRIPIFEKNRDNIIGILYVKDLFPYWVDKKTIPELREILRKPYYVPETKKISALLSEFKDEKVHMAIILDEYGGTAGLTTIEDILEEIVGEIADEYDHEEKLAPIKNIGDNVVEVDARLDIDELNSEVGLELPEDEDFETLGGFVFSHIGKIPRVNERFNYGNLEFIVIDCDDRKINRVKIIIDKKGA